MSGSYNKVILMGNLTRDVETRTAGSSTVASLGLAVNRRWKTEAGEQREEVTFIDCEAWGRTAEVMAQYLAKGRPVFVEGRLKLETWDDKKTGEKRSKLKVVVDSFQFVDSRADGGGQAKSPAASQPVDFRAGIQTKGTAPAQRLSDDDIPF